jgi:putative endonuclease
VNRRELGSLGEKLAADALKKKGYRILGKNYRCPHGEIDIVAKKGDCLVFIEVRSKSGTAFGSPEESVTGPKRERLVSTALDYLSNHSEMACDWRIDFVAVEFDRELNRATRIEIVENAVA